MSSGRVPFVSLIIPAKNEGNSVRTTVESALRARTFHPVEIVIVDDGSTDDCCAFLKNAPPSDTVKCITTPGIGAARARNLGAEHAMGDYLIFCDAHMYFPDYWIDQMLGVIRSGKAHAVCPGIASTEHPNLVGYGQTLNRTLGIQWNRHVSEPSPVPILPGACLAVSREVFWDVGGFDRRFRVWGFEDVEISIKLWLFGYTCYVQPSVKVLHLFRKAHPYPVSYDHVHYNMMRMAYSHFNDRRISACRNLIHHVDPAGVEAEVLGDDVMEQRQHYFARRKYDDNWFMQRFHIPF